MASNRLASGKSSGRLDRTTTDIKQPVALDLDHAPARAAQARVDAEDADG